MASTVYYKGQTLTTVNNQTRTLLTEGKYMEDDVSIVDVTASPSLESKSVTITPTESSQSQTVSPTSPTYDGLSSVSITVNPISSTYVGTGITRRDSTDLSATGATVSVPSGYYESNETYTIASGSATTPATTISVTPTISIDSSGVVTASVSGSQNVTPTVSAGYVSSGTAGTVSVSGSNTYQLTVRDSTDLSAVGDTVTAPSGYYPSAATFTIVSGSATTPATTITASATFSVSNTGLVTATISGSQSITPTVSAGYVSAGTAGTVSVSGTATHQLTVRDSSDMSASGATVTAPAGYYPSSATYTIASGTAGTPTATKGAVSSNSITVTPSVTNTGGYISGGTISGTGIIVSASELVSGNLPITSNGNNIDVTNYATVSVNVAGQSKNVQIASGVNRVATTSYTAVSGQSLTVAKTGIYNVYWSGYRSSTSGTNGSQLYIGNTAYGNAQTTFSNNGQSVHLSNVSLTQNQTITVRARSRNTSSYMYVANLTIVEA